MQDKTKYRSGANVVPTQSVRSGHGQQTRIETRQWDQPGTKAISSYSQSEQGRLCLLLDTSTSMSDLCENNRIKIDSAKEAAITSLGTLVRASPHTLVTLISFNHLAKVLVKEMSIEQGYGQFVSAIQAMVPDGGTDIPEVLKVARKHLKAGSSTSKDQIVMLTDGMGGDGVPESRRLKKMGVIISAVGFGSDPSDVNESMLMEMVSTVNGQPLYKFARTQQALTSTMVQFTRTQVR